MPTRNKILYPTDFSPASAAAFETAQHIARGSGSLLLIVHVVEPADQSPGPVIPEAMISGADFSPQAEKAVRQSREQLAHVIPDDSEINFEHRLLEGMAGKEIADLTDREEANLIVMGTHGRTGLKRLLMGSVAETVVHRLQNQSSSRDPIPHLFGRSSTRKTSAGSFTR